MGFVSSLIDLSFITFSLHSVIFQLSERAAITYIYVSVRWWCNRAVPFSRLAAVATLTNKNATKHSHSKMETPSSELENQTNTTWRHDDKYSVGDTGRVPVYLLLTVYPIVFVFGVLGNALVITVIVK